MKEEREKNSGAGSALWGRRNSTKVKGEFLAAGEGWGAKGKKSAEHSPDSEDVARGIQCR